MINLDFVIKHPLCPQHESNVHGDLSEFWFATKIRSNQDYFRNIIIRFVYLCHYVILPVRKFSVLPPYL